MTVLESVVKLGLGKDKLGSSKFEKRGVCEKDHKKDVVDGNDNDNNSGNGKPRVGKKKPKRKRDKLKYFICDGPYMLKKCLKKSALKEKPVSKALVLGSSKCPRKSVIEGNDGADKEPKKLGSSKGKSKTKRAKMIKRKATSKLDESSEGLPPKEEVSFSLDLEGKFTMKIVKLGPMRLKLSEASELAELSTRLPPMGDVGGASGFKGKEVMQVGKLTRVNAKVHSEHFDSVLHSNLFTWQERRGPLEVLEQRGLETMGKAKPSVVTQEDFV
ncbi:hypothetical protein Golax_020328 [Gossypium laxum]|uniref:Uncharacterized protein n=1 Tax=Gossypium laxum TaxID=34288 RepID=A0A7J9B7C4_9ROSI|nr:hypothetical protein [Gossypium laxum]